MKQNTIRNIIVQCNEKDKMDHISSNHEFNIFYALYYKNMQNTVRDLKIHTIVQHLEIGILNNVFINN